MVCPLCVVRTDYIDGRKAMADKGTKPAGSVFGIPLKAWDLMLKALIPVVVFLCGVLLSHEMRITKIESNRFTLKDGQVLEDKIRKDYPPQWLREQIAEMKVTLIKIEDRLRKAELRNP